MHGREGEGGCCRRQQAAAITAAADPAHTGDSRSSCCCVSISGVLAAFPIRRRFFCYSYCPVPCGLSPSAARLNFSAALRSDLRSAVAGSLRPVSRCAQCDADRRCSRELRRLRVVSGEASLVAYFASSAASAIRRSTRAAGDAVAPRQTIVASAANTPRTIATTRHAQRGVLTSTRMVGQRSPLRHFSRPPPLDVNSAGSRSLLVSRRCSRALH